MNSSMTNISSTQVHIKNFRIKIYHHFQVNFISTILQNYTWLQNGAHITINNGISNVLSSDPCFGVLHYDSVNCNCSYIEVYLTTSIKTNNFEVNIFLKFDKNHTCSQNGDHITIDNDISNVLSSEPCFGALHYDNVGCNCSYNKVFSHQ